MSDRRQIEGYSDDETFELVYDYWYSQCARTILKDILEKIIHKHKQKVEYPIPQESFNPPKREEAAEYRVGPDARDSASLSQKKITDD